MRTINWLFFMSAVIAIEHRPPAIIARWQNDPGFMRVPLLPMNIREMSILFY